MKSKNILLTIALIPVIIVCLLFIGAMVALFISLFIQLYDLFGIWAIIVPSFLAWFVFGFHYTLKWLIEKGYV